jgi:hypothetical protein
MLLIFMINHTNTGFAVTIKLWAVELYVLLPLLNTLIVEFEVNSTSSETLKGYVYVAQIK